MIWGFFFNRSLFSLFASEMLYIYFCTLTVLGEVNFCMICGHLLNYKISEKRIFLKINTIIFNIGEILYYFLGLFVACVQASKIASP